jgi:hypothetical protein
MVATLLPSLLFSMTSLCSTENNNVEASTYFFLFFGILIESVAARIFELEMMFSAVCETNGSFFSIFKGD